LRKLEVVNKAMENALRTNDLTAWAKADELFHKLLIEHSGNKRLLRMYHTITDQSHRARMITLRIRPKPGISRSDAVNRGSPSEARELAKRHRVRASSQLIPLLVVVAPLMRPCGEGAIQSAADCCTACQVAHFGSTEAQTTMSAPGVIQTEYARS
jgi:FCD domain